MGLLIGVAVFALVVGAGYAVRERKRKLKSLKLMIPIMVSKLQMKYLKLITPIVLDLAVAGDPTTATLGVEKREQIINTLSDPKEHGEFDALLFSGGGDDVSGDQFCLWITDNTGSDTGINQQAFSDILGVVETAYRDLFAICGDIQPNCKIFIHSYDFARPTGVGVCPLLTGGYARGPWLKPSLDYRQWTDFTSASALVEALLRELDTLFLALEGEYKPRVVYVKTQGTLIPPQSIADNTSDWANELHPTEPGFEKIAEKFRVRTGSGADRRAL